MTKGTLAFIAALLLPAVTVVAADPPPPPVVVGLDHIPIAVGDLTRAADDFQRLGFALKPGRAHENGIRNQHLKFRDGTELELITAREARDELTDTYVKHLASGDGPAFLAYFAQDPDALMRRLESIGQAFKSKRGLVSLPGPADRRFIFFFGRNASPTDRPEHFAHPNGAESLVGVWLAVDHLDGQRALLKALGASLREEVVHVPERANATVARFAEGEVVLLPASRQIVTDRPIVGAVLRTRSLDETRRALENAGVKTAQSTDDAGRQVLFIAPADAHGMWLAFREK